MIRGSTPTLYFKVKNIEDFSTVVDIWITISPYGKNGGSLTKKIKDMKVDTAENIISLSLTQEETMLMGPVIEIQLKVLLESGQVVVSPIFERPVGRLLNWIPMYCPKPEEQPPSDVIIPGDGDDDPENPGGNEPGGDVDIIEDPDDPKNPDNGGDDIPGTGEGGSGETPDEPDTPSGDNPDNPGEGSGEGGPSDPGTEDDTPDNPNPGSGIDPENPDSPDGEGGDPENPGGNNGNPENPDNPSGGSEPTDPPSGGDDGGNPDPDNPGEGGSDPVDPIPGPDEGKDLDPGNEPTPAPGDDGDVDIIVDEDD